MSAPQNSEEAAFLAGFAGDNGTEPAPAPVAEATTDAPNTPDESNVESQSQEAEAPKEPQAEPAKIAGFTEDELRNLLARVAKVDELETSLRKAHGKLGELNGRLQEKEKAPVQKASEPEMDLSHIEEDYPDIAAWVRKQLESKEPAKDEQPVQQQPQQPTSVDGATNEMIELALMDRLHKGWREKVQSQEFNLWLAASGEETRDTYQTAATADELGPVISGFDKWQESKGARTKTANDRLERAMTPTGSAGKPKVAPSAEDAFLTGFKSVFAR